MLLYIRKLIKEITMTDNSVKKTSFVNSASNFLEGVFEGGKAIGREVFCIDRSYQVFGDGSQNAQLKGRSKMITRALVVIVVAAVMIGLLAMSGHPGAFGYLMIAGFALNIILGFKEIVIQSLSRNREKQVAGITAETPETQYTLQELVEDTRKGFLKHLNMDSYRERMNHLTNSPKPQKRE